MIVRYKRNANDSLMVIKDNNILENDYRINMIVKNNISGLLEATTNYFNGEIEMIYVISSRQNLNDYFIKGKIGYHDIKRIIDSIIQLEKEINRYLLNMDDVILLPEYIFVNKESERIEYCYYTENDKSFLESFREFIQKLIHLTDHSDKKAVKYIYDIFELCNDNSFVLQDIEVYLQNNNYNKEENITVEKDVRIEKYYENEEGMRNDFLYGESEERNKKNIIVEFISRLFGGKEKEKIPIVCEEENLYCLENKMGESENKEKFNEDSEGNLYTNKIYSENECETMYIKDILMQKDRQLFSMSEMDDIEIKSFPFIIGKSGGKSDGIINDNAISRVHAKIDFENDQYTIEDLNSKNGTFVNDEIIDPYQVVNISIGDKITIASFDYIFR